MGNVEINQNGEYSGNALPKIVVVKNKVFGYKTNHDMMISGHHGDIIDNIWDFTEEPNNNSSFWLRIPSNVGYIHHKS